mgnify:CR=1 FL=1
MTDVPSSRPEAEPEPHPEPPGESAASPPDDVAVSGVREGVERDATADTRGDGAISVEDLITTVEAVTAERDGHLADLQRISAEFANFRKQTARRQDELVAQAAGRLAGELLPVLDAFDAAMAQGVEGIDHVRDQLLAVLTKEGLEPLAEVGEAFDPERHEAAMTQPADDGDDDGPVVAEVLRAGYGWNGRVLRAAMVTVKG